MALVFPSNPSVNDTYQVNGRTYVWNGTTWRTIKAPVPDVLPTLSVDNDFSVDTTTLHVDSTNNRVGIGTTAPSQELDVNGDIVVPVGNGFMFDRVGSDSHILYKETPDGSTYGSPDDVVLRNPNNASLRFQTGGTNNRVTVDSSGNVGINDATPSYTLDVNGDIRSTGSFYLTGMGSVPVGEKQTYTPNVLVGSSIGNGTTSGWYYRVGDLIYAYANFTLGSTSTWDKRYGRISAPIASSTGGAHIISFLRDVSAGVNYVSGGYIADGGNFRVSGWRVLDASAGSGLVTGYFLDLSNDFGFGEGDFIDIFAVYSAP